jgi:hypothetical protein
MIDAIAPHYTNQCFQSQLPHQPMYPFAVELESLPLQPHAHAATAIAGRFEVLLIQ